MTIVEELRENPESGVRRLETEYKAGLLNLACRFCQDPGDAEELVNRTFAAVVDGIDGFMEQSSFFTWMSRILTNIHCMDNRRKSREMEVFPGDVPDIADERANEEIYRNLDAALVREALKLLPPDQRESIVLHYFLDIPVTRMAKILAVPAGTVNSRLHYARKALAAKLGAAARKPGARALLLAILLGGLTALGAAVSIAVAHLPSPEPAAQERQARDSASDGSAPSGTHSLPASSLQPFLLTDPPNQGEIMNTATPQHAATTAAKTRATDSSPDSTASAGVAENGEQPRQGFHASRSSLGLASAFVAIATAANVQSAVNGVVAETDLPDPDAGGAYVFGNPDYSASSFYETTLTAGLSYPVWDRIGVPAGSTVKFVGGVALSALPEDCTFDFSGCTHLLVTDDSVFGSGFTVPERTTLLYLKCSATVEDSEIEDGQVVPFSTPAWEAKIGSPLVIDGTQNVGNQNGNVVFNGDVAGAETGYMELNGFNHYVTFNGALDFSGMIRFRNSQRYQRVTVKSADAESRIGALMGADWNNGDPTQTVGAPPQLLYTPAASTPCTLVITNFNQDGQGGLNSPESTGKLKYRRWGILLCKTSNNTIRIENLQSDGAVHLMACSDGAYTFGNEPSFDEGFANFEIVNLGNKAIGTASLSPVFYPSPNVNVTFTGRFTGMFAHKAPSFDYTAESNAVNRGSLDMSGAESYQWAHQPIRITGYSPWNLPRSIKVHSNLASVTTNSVTDARWVMPLDFGAAADEIDVARCESDAILSIPASGTVVVSNATTAAGAVVVPGSYPVITGRDVVNSAGATGASAFVGWAVERAGTDWHGSEVTLEATDAGLWMVVSEMKATTLIFR